MITSLQFHEMLARLNRNTGRFKDSVQPPVEVESDLHEQIKQLCNDMAWFYVHSRMDKPTTTAEGVPDFIIAVNDGRTLWIECKSKTGKPTPRQLATIAHLKELGHEAEIIRSIGQLVQLVASKKNIMLV